MPAQPVLIFANPIAGRGMGRAIAERLANRLRRDGLDPRVIFRRADEADEDLLARGARAAVAIGGDGTVRAVARRLVRSFAGGKTPPLLVVPMGTANLLGRHLGTRWTQRELPAKVSAAVRSLKTIELDAASANGELFLLMAGVGLDAKVVHELDRIRSGPIDYTSYALPAALAFGFYSYPPLTVEVDGKVVARALPGVAFVGNVKEYGTGFPILPHARPDDGLLDVCVLPCASRLDAVRQLMRAVSGEHVEAEGTVYLRGKHVRIDSSEPVPVQVDGEAAGHTPLEIKLLPVRVPFIVPGE
jgi:diacylglycerol kinase family enzyme